MAKIGETSGCFKALSAQYLVNIGAFAAVLVGLDGAFSSIHGLLDLRVHLSELQSVAIVVVDNRTGDQMVVNPVILVSASLVLAGTICLMLGRAISCGRSSSAVLWLLSSSGLALSPIWSVWRQ